MMESRKQEAADRGIVHVERSLRSLPPQYAPSLVFCHGKKLREQTFCTLSDGYYHTRSIPEMRQMRCIASCYGWLIMQNFYDPTQCHLFEPISLTKIQLPPLKDNTFRDGVLTSPPSDSNCVVLFVSVERKSFIRCRIGDKEWIEKYLRSKKEMSELALGYTKVLICGGKMYTFFRRGMFVTDVHDDTYSTKLYERKWWCYASTSDVMKVDVFFVESCGEIFYVMAFYLGASGCIYKRFDVFKLDMSTMDMVKVHSIDDRVFLLGATSSTSFSSTESGMKGNCMYFCNERYTCLNKFDMVDGTLTTTLPCPKKFTYWRGPFWVVPNCKLQAKNETVKFEDTEDHLYGEDENQQQLPIDISELILSDLILGDSSRFRLTSKASITITPPIRPYTSLIQSESISQHLPWFLSFPNDNKSLCKFYHPIYSDAKIMNIPHELADAIVRHAKYGWLLMSQGKKSIFFFNPFTMETIKLPELLYTFENISFSSPPTSNDCVVFGHDRGSRNSVLLSVYRKCEDAWSFYDFNTLKFFYPSHCSPVFCDGVFYSLGKDGKLGVFNPNETEEENMWRLLPIALPQEISSSSCLNVFVNFFPSFIMEVDGEILSVFVGHRGKKVCVYKLDQPKMKWAKLESLGDRVIFLSHTGSLVVPAGLKGIENRIYFPRFQGRENVFYSLSSGKYHSFGRKSSRDDWMDTCEHLNCTWIQPVQELGNSRT